MNFHDDFDQTWIIMRYKLLNSSILETLYLLK